MKDLNKRFQNQPLYIRLWRRRHYWYVPIDAFRTWWYNRNDPDMDFQICWGIAVGSAQLKMKWYYTWDEIKADLEIKEE